MYFKNLANLKILATCALFVQFTAAHAQDKISLKHQNEGVNFYTSEQIYSQQWRDALDYALNKYQEILYTPSPIDVYLVESRDEASQLRQQKINRERNFETSNA